MLGLIYKRLILGPISEKKNREEKKKPKSPNKAHPTQNLIIKRETLINFSHLSNLKSLSPPHTSHFSLLSTHTSPLPKKKKKKNKKEVTFSSI